MKSLRLRLVLFLLLGLGAVWGVSLWVGHQEARHEVDELFDAQLAQSAQAILESSRHTIHERHEHGDDETDMPVLHQYEQKLIFQVWSIDGKLLQRSSGAPDRMLGKLSSGYQTVVGEKVSWRVLTRFDKHGEYLVQVAEPLATRELLARHISLKILLPTLLVLPLMVLLIWWFVGKGLRPLRDISQQVKSRAANRLDALKINEVPDEVTPLAKALNDLFARLQSAFESERRFTTDAAHELRTPLAGLKIQAQVAIRAVDDEERKAALEKVLQGVDRATHLIAQLLTLARVDPESAASQHVKLSLHQLAASVVEECRSFAQSRGINVFLADSDAEIRGDADQLAVLMRNLLDNALRYTPANGKVEIAIRDDDALEIADSGPGIAPEERVRVLERFYRVQGNEQPGSGLGLSIVKRIAQLHGATLALESSASSGLLVRVKFPHGKA